VPSATEITVAKLQAGDQAALAALCERRGPAVFAYCEQVAGTKQAGGAAADAFAHLRTDLAVLRAVGAEELLRSLTRRAALARRIEAIRQARPSDICGREPDLIGYIEDQYDDDVRADVAQHARECHLCGTSMQRLRSGERILDQRRVPPLPPGIAQELLQSLTLAVPISIGPRSAPALPPDSSDPSAVATPPSPPPPRRSKRAASSRARPRSFNAWKLVALPLLIIGVTAVGAAILTMLLSSDSTSAEQKALPVELGGSRVARAPRVEQPAAPRPDASAPKPQRSSKRDDSAARSAKATRAARAVRSARAKTARAKTTAAAARRRAATSRGPAKSSPGREAARAPARVRDPGPAPAPQRTPQRPAPVAVPSQPQTVRPAPGADGRGGGSTGVPGGEFSTVGET